VQAAKADVLSLTAFEVWLFGWRPVRASGRAKYWNAMPNAKAEDIVPDALRGQQ